LIAGYDVESYWQQTPRTIHLAFVARNRSLLRGVNRERGLAWNIANLQRARRLPPMKSWLLREPGRRQTWQEQYEIAKAWVANAAKEGKKDG
jgi:hypothetical protein